MKLFRETGTYLFSSTQPPPPVNVLDTAFYIKLKATLEVVSVWVWEVLKQQYQFNDLENRIPKLDKGKQVNKSMEEKALELNRDIYVDAKLIGKFITQQVAAAMAKKKNVYK